MKRKIVIITLFLILIALGGLVFWFISGIKQDQQITKEKSKEIIAAYNDFNSSVQAFAALREQYYVTREETFLEDFEVGYENWNKFIVDYENSIKDVDKNSKVLKKNCVVKFADVRVSSRCTNFKANYEAAMNYYITDIKGYNKTVKQFNDWAAGQGKNVKLNEGTYPVYSKYIDFDEDGEKFGKGEDNNE